MKTNAIVVGAGIAGLVTTVEIAQSGKRVILIDQEPESSLGGQAWWSFGGLFLVDSKEQRRLGIKDSFDLAWNDWKSTAGFDREEDEWGKKWAKAYVEFSASEKREWLRSFGIRFFPVVGWAERGGSLASGHGNSVPRFHIVWGTGPGIVTPFAERMQSYVKQGLVTYLPRHRAEHLLVQNEIAYGVEGSILKNSIAQRGEASNRIVVDSFTLKAENVVITSGGIGANHELIRKNWPERLGKPPKNMLSGVPEHVDGKMLEIAEHAGARIVHRDRMWHYTEGIKNWNSVWENHGIRILPGPSSIWLDAEGNRFNAPNYPGFDTLSTLEAIQKTGYDYSWFILTQKIIEKEFALSGSEQNPDLTNKRISEVLKRAQSGAPGPVQNFLDHGEDFVMASNLKDLIQKMNKLTEKPLLQVEQVTSQIKARDLQLANKFTKDLQLAAMYNSRKFLGDKLIRTAKPHPILKAENGPLIGVKLHILSRKTLGGLQTDLSGRVFNQQKGIIKGLYAAGEVAGFGGGGMHGYRALEGTFVGGCLFSGRTVGRSIARGK
ncbi:FAD-binding dehydrogenase [Oceanobacillus sp. 1P07AA]|uniref:FAD-binding dehydrogenase n=1 Tax=Oceanobacillus sp. 1P07AA TaxID=3132293 RepID=UPI0039A69DA2